MFFFFFTLSLCSVILLRRCHSSSTFNVRKYQRKKALLMNVNRERKIHGNVSLLKKSKVFRRVDKLINYKIENVTCLEKKKSQKLLYSHWNMTMQPQLGNSRKSSQPLLKLLSNLGSRDTKKI